MVQIIVDGVALQTPANLSLPLELRSSFSLQDEEALQSSFSLPFTIPATRSNLNVLRNPHLPGAAFDQTELQCTVYLESVPWFAATLFVDEASTASVEVHLVIDITSGLKDLTLRDLDFGPSQQWADDQPGIMAHMRDTIDNPTAYPHVFTPIRNQFILDEDLPNGSGAHYWQNFFDFQTLTFQYQQDPLTAFSPQPYIRSLFDAAQRSTGVKVLAPFLDGELSTLWLYSNGIISSSAGVQTEWDMAALLPQKRKLTDVIKVLCQMFCANVDLNPFSRTVTITPLREKVAMPVQADWTHKLASPLSISPNKAILTKFSYKDYESYHRGLSDLEWDYDIDDHFSLDSTYPPGIYRELPTSTLYDLQVFQIPGTSTTGFDRRYVGWTLASVDLGNGQALEVEGGAMVCADSTGLVELVPQIEVAQLPEVPPLLFGLFRGVDNGRPISSSNRYSRVADLFPNAKYSLYWDGDDGLYNTWYRPVLQRLHGAKIMKGRFVLSRNDILGDIRNNKILVAGRECLVLSMSLDVTGTDKHLADVTILAL